MYFLERSFAREHDWKSVAPTGMATTTTTQTTLAATATVTTRTTTEPFEFAKNWFDLVSMLLNLFVRNLRIFVIS